MQTEPLRVEVHIDPDASPGRLVEAIAALLLARARQTVLRDGESRPDRLQRVSEDSGKGQQESPF